jgi:hypothetical protein
VPQFHQAAAAEQHPPAPQPVQQGQMLPYMIMGLEQAANHLAQSLKQIVAGMAQNDQQVAELRKMLTTDKRIIRHPQTGRAVGIEHVAQ